MPEDKFISLEQWIDELADILKQEKHPNGEHYVSFLKHPEWMDGLVDIFEKLPEELPEESIGYHSACVLAFDICVSQLQMGVEHQNKYADRRLHQLMDNLSQTIVSSSHSLGFWLPLLNSFYESQVELSAKLQDAFMEIAGREEPDQPLDDEDYIQSIREILKELSGMSDFEIAEHFFSQSHAMPAEFFMDLLFDLFSTEQGPEIGILFLLHPKKEVRQVVLVTLDHLLPRMQLTPLSLSRLQQIQAWYPEKAIPYFQRWIKDQRRRGGQFLPTEQLDTYECHATEIDGSGSQGVIFQLKLGKKRQICAILYKDSIGIKEAWTTTVLTQKEVKQYYHEMFDEQITLRRVDLPYVKQMTNHFLSIALKKGEVPSPHFLEIQMLLGVSFVSEPIEPENFIQELGIQIVPFTTSVLEDALKNTKRWFRDKAFTSSWFEEDAAIDACVNQCCSIVDGVKVCALEQAQTLVLSKVFELHREKWAFHFLWTALWAKARATSEERFWKDAFFIAHAIYSGRPLSEIPVMRDICQLSVLNSLETMQERKAYLKIQKNG